VHSGRYLLEAAYAKARTGCRITGQLIDAARRSPLGGSLDAPRDIFDLQARSTASVSGDCAETATAAIERARPSLRKP